MNTDEINIWAILAAGLASFVLGALWYSPLFFSKIWQREVEMTDDKIKQGNIAATFLSSFALMLLMSFGMAFFMAGSDISGTDGIVTGLLTGIFFVGPSTGINYLYQRKSFALWCIDAGYQIIFLGITGGILAAWA